MKIAFVISTFPPKAGGMGEVCYQEAKRLSALGHDITVFTLSFRGLNLEFDKDLPFKVVRLFTPFTFGDAGLAVQLLFKLSDFDLVHLHYPFYGSDFLVLLACLIWQTPYVVTYHMDAKPVGFLKRSIQMISDRLLAGMVLSQAKKVIVVDTHNREQFSLLKKVSANSVAQIANAVDTEVFHHYNITREELGYQDLADKKVLLFVGNLLAVKRLDLVLSALKKLADPSLCFLIIGDGYEKKKYQDFSMELDLSSQVFFLGKILDKNLLAKYYSISDVTIIPSDYESFSLVALESLACATPVISSKIDGTAGRINDGEDGLFFSPRDIGDLALKIVQFFNYPKEQRDKMGQSGRRKVISNYNWNEHIQELLKIYQNK